MSLRQEERKHRRPGEGYTSKRIHITLGKGPSDENLLSYFKLRAIYILIDRTQPKLNTIGTDTQAFLRKLLIRKSGKVPPHNTNNNS